MGLSPELAPEEGSVEREEPLSRHTTWRIGGPARYFCRVKTEAGLARLLAGASRGGEPLAILGMGSNILVADEGFPGYVLRLEGDFLKVEIDGERVRAGGGAALGGVCAAAARAGLSGLEAISGIPSSIGGAVRINAGAYGGEIFDVLESLRLVSRTGEVRAAAASEIPHGYRSSGLMASREIVSLAVLKLAPAPREEIQAKTRTVAEKRRGALPSEPNAGSVFKNPDGDYAGRLVEACGLKGEREGGARISERHANVIVNTGGARAEDVLVLMRKMRDAVRAKFGVTLLPEVEMLGVKWD
jgi:UDP-N-acetylmuramate dehydrogenase